jgi:hypothetical protein
MGQRLADGRGRRGRAVALVTMRSKLSVQDFGDPAIDNPLAIRTRIVGIDREGLRAFQDRAEAGLENGIRMPSPSHSQCYFVRMS